jgi:hypothetical protein
MYFRKMSFVFVFYFKIKLKKLVNLLENIIKIEMEDFTYLICWDGVGELKRWKLILPDGSPVKIEQTIHQIGVTKDYVVLMDTAFTAGSVTSDKQLLYRE